MTASSATVAAASAVAPELVLPALREALAGHYRLLAVRNSADGQFLIGWLARAYS